MKSTNTTKSILHEMCTLLQYQAKIIILSGKNSVLHYQARAVYYIIRKTLLHYQAASLLHYQVMLLHHIRQLLHHQAVITLTGDYYITNCNMPVAYLCKRAHWCYTSLYMACLIRTVTL